MEQVTLSSLPPGTYIRGRQALLLRNNNQNLNLTACFKGDIIQQALSGINTNIPAIPDLSTQKVNIGQNGFILDKDETEEERVVQLSISEDFPLNLINSRSEDNFYSSDQQSILLDVLSSTNDKSDNSLDSLNSFLQLSPENVNSDAQEDASVNHKGNLIYPYQLTNGSKTYPATKNVAVSAPNTSNGFSNVASTPSGFMDASKVVPESQNTPRYVILRDSNLKPRYVLNLNKNKLETGKNNAQKLQVLPVGGKILLNKSLRNIAPQKMALPPSKRPRLKETLNQNNIARQPQNQEHNESKSVGTSLLLSTLLKTDPVIEKASSEKNVTSHVQIIQNNNVLELQDKILPTSVVLHPNTSTFPNFQSSPVESAVQVIQNSNNSNGLQTQNKLLPSCLIIQPDGTITTSFVSSVTEGHAKIQSTLKKDSSPKTLGKVLPTDSMPQPKVKKATKSRSAPGRCTEDQLKKIQTAFKNGELNINGKNNSSVIYDQETKIICKLLYPEEFSQKDDNAEQNKNSANKKKKVRKLRGRMSGSNDTKETVPQDKAKKSNARKNLNNKLPRTRSGRLSRPPRYMFKGFKKLSIHHSHSDISSAESEIDENIESIADTEPPLETPDLTAIVEPVKPKVPQRTKNRCPTCGKNYPGFKMLLHLKKYPDHGDSNTLFLNHANSKDSNLNSSSKKIFARRKNLNKLESAPLKDFLASVPDKVLITAIKDRASRILSPWDFLVERQPAGEGAVKGILTDLSDIFKALPLDMLEKTIPSHPNAIHITDEKLCQVLNISPGSYLPNDAAIKPPTCEVPLPESMTSLQNCPLSIPEHNSKPMDNSIAMNEEISVNQKSEALPVNEVLQTNKVLPMSHIIPSDGALSSNSVIPSSQDLFVKDENSLDLEKKDLTDILLDKSSIDTVDEILNDRLIELMPLDPLGENSTLSRSIFSTNSLELHGVSGSTEDLLKSLENLAPELNTVTEPPDFDFSVLSNDFVTDR